MSFVEQDAIMKKLEVSQGERDLLLIQHTGTTRCVLFILKELFFLVLLTPWTHVNLPPQCFINNFFSRNQWCTSRGCKCTPKSFFWPPEKGQW